jgi:hypothetical protein
MTAEKIDILKAETLSKALDDAINGAPAEEEAQR